MPRPEALRGPVAILFLVDISATKIIFSSPPKNSPIRRRHPPGPSALPPPGETPPPPGIFDKKPIPPPPSRRLGLSLPPPQPEKIKRSETSTKFSYRAMLATIVSQDSFVLVFGITRLFCSCLCGVSQNYRAICCNMGYRLFKFSAYTLWINFSSDFEFI